MTHLSFPPQNTTYVHVSIYVFSHSFLSRPWGPQANPKSRTSSFYTVCWHIWRDTLLLSREKKHAYGSVVPTDTVLSPVENVAMFDSNKLEKALCYRAGCNPPWDCNGPLSKCMKKELCSFGVCCSNPSQPLRSIWESPRQGLQKPRRLHLSAAGGRVSCHHWRHLEGAAVLCLQTSSVVAMYVRGSQLRLQRAYKAVEGSTLRTDHSRPRSLRTKHQHRLHPDHIPSSRLNTYGTESNFKCSSSWGCSDIHLTGTNNR